MRINLLTRVKTGPGVESTTSWLQVQRYTTKLHTGTVGNFSMSVWIWGLIYKELGWTCWQVLEQLVLGFGWFLKFSTGILSSKFLWSISHHEAVI